MKLSVSGLNVRQADRPPFDAFVPSDAKNALLNDKIVMPPSNTDCPKASLLLL